MRCPTCNLELAIGDWPFCPHGEYHGTVIGDDIPGGFVQEHFGHTPETFYSKKAMLKRADALGLRRKDECGTNDRGRRWVSVDLEAAKALVSRMGAPAADPDVPCETFTYSVKDVA